MELDREGHEDSDKLEITATQAALEITHAIEGKDKAEMVEEALRLRRALMGEEYQRTVEAAIAVRLSDDPTARLKALEELREDGPDATPDGFVSVAAAVARIRARRLGPE